MGKSLYELIALGARYLFAALMVLIVARAWRITLVDSRRAQTLRRLSPETGIIGELIVMEGDEKARRGMRYPVILEGMIGASRRADIRIRHSSVRRRHAWFQLNEDGLYIRAHAGAPLRRGRRVVRELTVQDGDVFEIGRVRLMLVLSVNRESEYSEAPRRRIHRDDPEAVGAMNGRAAGAWDDETRDSNEDWDERRDARRATDDWDERRDARRASEDWDERRAPDDWDDPDALFEENPVLKRMSDREEEIEAPDPDDLFFGG